jgi:hypothetical protein
MTYISLKVKGKVGVTIVACRQERINSTESRRTQSQCIYTVKITQQIPFCAVYEYLLYHVLRALAPLNMYVQL